MSNVVLLVNNNEEKLQSLSKALNGHSAGFRTLEVKSGNEAYAKSRNQSFSAVVTSLELPGLSGVDLINALRENYTNSKIPIIVYGTVPAMIVEDLKKFSDVHVYSEVQAEHLLGDFLNSILKKQTNAAPGSTFKFDVNFINPFIDAVCHTLETVADAKNIQVGSPYLLKKGDRLGIDISGTISMLAPQFSGVMATCFPEKTYLNVVGKMLGEEYKEITADIEDAAGELTNIIFGQTKKVLETKGLNLEKAIPSVIRGRDHSITHQSTGPILVSPFTTNLGNLFIQICSLKLMT